MSPKLELLQNFALEFLIEIRTLTVNKALRLKFFEKISELNVSQVQISNFFFHLFRTYVNSSKELTRVI